MEANAAIEKHANEIVVRLAMSKEEREEMKNEFSTHMTDAKNDYKNEGYSEKEAEKMAIAHFGKQGKIADDMHEVLFPFRRLAFFLLAILSLVTVFSTYLSVLFTAGDAHYGALITAVLTSTAFLILSRGKHPRWEKKQYLIILLMLHGLFFIYQSFLSGSITTIPVMAQVLTIFAYTIVLFVILLIYMVALANTGKQRGLQWLHLINITFGIGLSAYSLFFLWAFLAFGGEESYMVIIRFLLITALPLLSWIVAYTVEISLWNHDKKTAAYVVFFIFSLLLIVGVGSFLTGAMLV